MEEPSILDQKPRERRLAVTTSSDSLRQIWHVEPYGEASIGPIIFEPFQHAQWPSCKGQGFLS